MVDPHSPSNPSRAVARALRGASRMRISREVRKSKETGFEDMDDFWDASRTPTRSPATNKERFKKKKNNKSAATKSKSNTPKGKVQPNFSLPGSEEVADQRYDVDSASLHRQRIEKFIKRTKGGAVSPSELSRVSTLPPPTPTPVKKKSPARRKSPEQEPEEELQEDVIEQHPEEEEEDPLTQNDNVEEHVVQNKSRKQKTPPREIAAPPPLDDDDDDFPAALDDDASDLIPPPPPDPFLPSSPGTASIAPSLAPSVATSLAPSVRSSHRKSAKKQKKATPSPRLVQQSDDDDDDDKEGAGFEMASPQFDSPQLTPEDPKSEDEEENLSPPAPSSKVVSGRKKKKVGRPRKLPMTLSPKSTPPPPKRTKKGKKNKFASAPFTPKGIQSGPIEHEFVPVSDYKEPRKPEERGMRRSKRSKIKPLAFWKNERPIFEPNTATGRLKEAMGSMSVVAGYEKALPTPYRKRKIPQGGDAGKKKKKKKNASAVRYEDEPVEVKQRPFDARKLKKKYSYLEGSEATLWDEDREISVDMKAVCYAADLEDVTSELPLPRARKKHEGKVVGSAGQSFNVPSGESDVSIGYIMGSLFLPPNGIKDPEATGVCSQVFTVVSCQPKALEIAYGDPDEEEGSLEPETAQRFLLGPGDQFRIPLGNVYRLHNHSKSTDAKLAWTIIRPRTPAHDL